MGRPKKPTPFRVEGDERIYTAKSKGTNKEFKFPVDFPIIDSAITVSSSGYATVYKDGTMKKLNRIVLEWHLGRNIKDKHIADHISGDISDNTIGNLREVTCSQNSMNTKSKGYSFDKNRNKWQVRIMVNGKNIYIGRYNTEDEAIKASSQARLEYFGEYARQSQIA